MRNVETLDIRRAFITLVGISLRVCVDSVYTGIPIAMHCSRNLITITDEDTQFSGQHKCHTNMPTVTELKILQWPQDRSIRDGQHYYE